ncbi:MAG TPA: hypothetical protein DCL21_03415 [Alphaproteobacteria bacterium]|nr:hypothetical protein [Alphaproteobacteria bacterium]
MDILIDFLKSSALEFVPVLCFIVFALIALLCIARLRRHWVDKVKIETENFSEDRVLRTVEMIKYIDSLGDDALRLFEIWKEVVSDYTHVFKIEDLDAELSELKQEFESQTLGHLSGDTPVDFNADYRVFKCQLEQYLAKHVKMPYILQRFEVPPYADKGFRNLVIFAHEKKLRIRKEKAIGTYDKYVLEIAEDEKVRFEKSKISKLLDKSLKKLTFKSTGVAER